MNANIRQIEHIPNNYLGLIDVPERQADTSSKRPFFGTDAIAIDSMKLRIPEKRVNILDEEFKGAWRTFNDATGNEDTRLVKPHRKYIVTRGGIKINWQIEKITLSRTPERFLTLEVPSSILKGRYFEGIQNNTAAFAYQRLMSFKVAEFSFSDFVAADCTDIDFKTDRIIDGDFKTMISDIYKDSKHPDGSRIFTKTDNQGGQWSSREKPNAIQTPFIKIYNKGLALKTVQKDLYDSYLAQFDVSNIIRLEATLKNKKHYRHIYGDSSTGMRLGSLLDMSQPNKQKLFDYAAGKYGLMGKPAPIKLDKSTLKASQLIKLSLLQELRRVGYDREKAKSVYLSDFDGVANRNRYEREFEEIWGILEDSNGSHSIYTYDFFWKN